MGTRRYVWNKVLNGIKNGEKLNFYQLRNKYVTIKNNDTINDWEKQTPKDIRAGAIRDMVKGYNSAISNFKNGNINNFSLRYKKKKDNQSIEIPKTAIKYNNGRLYIYKTYINDEIKTSRDNYTKGELDIEYDCRLSFVNGEWYLYVPVKFNLKPRKNINSSCSLDPGVRKFQTIYSETHTMKIEMNKEVIRGLYTKIDTLRSLRARKIIKNNKGINRRMKRINNLIDDLHWKSINYVTSNFDTIFIPRFESQEIGKKMMNRKINRDLFQLKHYTFLERLKSKCRMIDGCNLIVCTEEYTSKTCGNCGILNDIGSREMYDCKGCFYRVDRDINGSRNIMIKCIKELER